MTHETLNPGLADVELSGTAAAQTADSSVAQSRIPSISETGESQGFSDGSWAWKYQAISAGAFALTAVFVLWGADILGLEFLAVVFVSCLGFIGALVAWLFGVATLLVVVSHAFKAREIRRHILPGLIASLLVPYLAFTVGRAIALRMPDPDQLPPARDALEYKAPE